MSVSPDIVRDITNFQPAKPRGFGERVSVGLINGGELFYGLVKLQRRAIHLKIETRIAGEYTLQPGLVLVEKDPDGRDIARPLIYSSHVQALGSVRAMEVWYKLIDARCGEI